MLLTVAAYSDVGRVRTNNEDSLLADRDLGLFIVCDGMGGHNAGEVASQTACQVLAREIKAAADVRERFRTTGSPDDAAALCKVMEAAMTAACREIYKRANKDPALAGMGTTCTLMLVAGNDKAVLAHVGDSRLYLIRGGQLHQLTEDHTYINELVRRGSLSREQARDHPQSNVLSRALGVQSTVAVECMIFDLDPGDLYLLCSDGLHNYFPDGQDLLAGLTSARLEDGLARVIGTALERGGHDNCTGIAIRVEGALEPDKDTTAAGRRISLLKRIPLFAHLGYSELARVVGLTRVAQAPAGNIIVREGDSGSELFVTLAGELEVEKSGRIIATLKAGSHFGEMAMIDSAPRSATVRARTAVNLLVMRRAEFFGLIRSEPVIASKLLWSFLQVLSGRLRDTNDALKTVTGGGEDAEVDVLFATDDDGGS